MLLPHSPRGFKLCASTPKQTLFVLAELLEECRAIGIQHAETAAEPDVVASWRASDKRVTVEELLRRKPYEIFKSQVRSLSTAESAKL